MYMMISEKVMYCLPPAGQIENDFLDKNIAPHGYFQCRITPGLWNTQMETRNYFFISG